MRFTFVPTGVCSTSINLEIEDGIIRQCAFANGCEGNLRAVSLLVEGRRAEDVIQLLQGITCEGHTSCPAQLARALSEYIEQKVTEL